MDKYELRREALAALVEQLGHGGIARVARAIEKEPSYVSRMLYGPEKKGRKRIGEDSVEALGRAFPTWLDAVARQAPSVQITPVPAALADITATQGQIAVWDSPADLPDDDGRVWIDRYDYQCSAGTGVIQWEIRQKRALPFTGEFFKAIGSKPANCRLGVARGPSMEPFLFDKDMIMIDISKTAVRDGNIYAVCFEDESLVKQVFKESGGVLSLHSYNPRFPDRKVLLAEPTNFHIVGEVVYRSGSGWTGS